MRCLGVRVHLQETANMGEHISIHEQDICLSSIIYLYCVVFMVLCFAQACPQAMSEWLTTGGNDAFYHINLSFDLAPPEWCLTTTLISVQMPRYVFSCPEILNNEGEQACSGRSKQASLEKQELHHMQLSREMHIYSYLTAINILARPAPGEQALQGHWVVMQMLHLFIG